MRLCWFLPNGKPSTASDTVFHGRSFFDSIFEVYNSCGLDFLNTINVAPITTSGEVSTSSLIDEQEEEEKIMDDDEMKEELLFKPTLSVFYCMCN